MKKWITIGLLLCLLLSCTACRVSEPIENIVKNPLLNNTTALKIGTHKISAVELNYFYMDSIEEYSTLYHDYVYLFLEDDKPLSEQFYNVESGETWADYFVDMAINKAHNVYALYDTAVAAGYTYAPEESISDTLKNQAELLGFKRVNDYLQSVYGDGAAEETYLEYYEKTQIAAGYFEAYSELLRNSYTEDDLNAYAEGSDHQYQSYTYATAYLSLENFLDADDPTDAELESAVAKMKSAVKSLCSPKNNTPNLLRRAISALGLPEFSTPVVSINRGVPYDSIPSSLQNWITDPSRKDGDIGATAQQVADEDGNAFLSGYYIVLMLDTDASRNPLANVRHILIAYEGGHYDSETGQTTYSESEKAAALKLANDILLTWQSGDATEESFAELAKVHSTDDGSRYEGGLYTDIYPGQMISTFDAWCFADERKPGDTDIVPSDYGMHIMYYVGDSELTYREFQIINDLLEDDLETWQAELLDSTLVEEVELSHVNRNLALKKTPTEE